MPELPDILLYCSHLRRLLVGAPVENIRIASPFVLRTVDPPVHQFIGKRIISVSRMGKRVVFEMEHDLFVVIHLMVAGRFHWKTRGASIAGRNNLISFDFPTGSLLVTEASTKKRASVHLVRGRAAVQSFDRGGLEVLEATFSEFDAALQRENHTLKRALTDPRLFSGIGNAYSDEILHRAKLSPLQLTGNLNGEEKERLFRAAQSVLSEWIERLRQQAAQKFPEHVTAFHPEMAVHGRYRKPCPVCGTAVQRIVYAENECNYCPRCQTGGKILADRSLSRLLNDDWPKTIEELEERR